MAITTVVLAAPIQVMARPPHPVGTLRLQMLKDPSFAARKKNTLSFSAQETAMSRSPFPVGFLWARGQGGAAGKGKRRAAHGGEPILAVTEQNGHAGCFTAVDCAVVVPPESLAEAFPKLERSHT